MKSKILFVFLITFQLISCQKQNSKVIETLDSKLYSEKLNSTENPQLLDVRTPDEYAVEHLEKAKNVDWNGSDFVSDVEKPPPKEAVKK